MMRRACAWATFVVALIVLSASIGMAQDPGRVFPGKRMAGQYGNVNRTVQTLAVVRVDAERGLLLVKGAVPGADGGHIVVRPAVRAPAKKGD